jgi:hypothetical protein
VNLEDADVPSVQWIGRQDPYAEVGFLVDGVGFDRSQPEGHHGLWMGNKYKSTVQTDGGKHPTFEEEAVLALSSDAMSHRQVKLTTATVNLAIFNQNTILSDTLIGCVNLEMSENPTNPGEYGVLHCTRDGDGVHTNFIPCLGQLISFDLHRPSEDGHVSRETFGKIRVRLTLEEAVPIAATTSQEYQLSARAGLCIAMNVASARHRLRRKREEEEMRSSAAVGEYNPNADNPEEVVVVAPDVLLPPVPPTSPSKRRPSPLIMDTP